MMILTRLILVAAFLCTPYVATSATNELGWTLESALVQIDRQARDFDTALADVEAQWQAAGADQPHRTATGRLYVNKEGVLRFNVESPEQHTLLVTKNEVQDYNPVRALVDSYSLSKHKARLEPYARLGFTTTGKDLRDDYLVTLLGEDFVNSRRLVGLELTPKKERAREVVARLQLWIDQASWMPVKQVIVHVASGDTLTITYYGMARNLKLNPDLFKDKWPKGTQQLKR
jgi:outer membrane lipoprotein-sorting protein